MAFTLISRPNEKDVNDFFKLVYNLLEYRQLSISNTKLKSHIPIEWNVAFGNMWSISDSNR